jgi:polyisoprenoid-binding protein YceI
MTGRIAAILWLALAVTPAAAQTSPIPDGVVREGSLSFDGKATVGDFTGTTTTVSGQFMGAASLDEIRGWVEAPVQTLLTGNSKRDKDLNKSMESEKYPALRFELTGVTPATGSLDSLPVTLHGRLQLHGVDRELELPAVLSMASDHARIRTTFPLNLKDYRIGGLTKMLGMLKMHEDIVVHVDVTFALK